jgi:GWxTD domain-containing protein
MQKRMVGPVCLGALLLLGSPTPPAAEETSSAPAAQPHLAAALHPGIGVGDFEFYVDVAGLHRGADGSVITRVLVQLPTKFILMQSKLDEIDLRLQVQVYGAQAAFAALQKRSAENNQRQQAQENDQSVQDLLETFDEDDRITSAEIQDKLRSANVEGMKGTDFSLFELSVELAPGNYVFDVTMENLSKIKTGLVDRMRNRPTMARARMLVRIPDLGATVAIADPVFRLGHVRHNDYPARVYGLLNDSLHVAATVFASGPTTVRALVADRDGKIHWQDSLTVQVTGQRNIGFDTSVNTFPAGQYVLTLWAQSSSAAMRAQRSFDVAWSLESWNKSYRDNDLEAAIVLTEGDYDTFRSLSTGEKEHFMDDFWAKQDPSPDTAHNEARQVFHGRVAFADEHFSETGRGALSDRGKVFIRFGPPNEIQQEAMPSHLAGTGTADLIAKVEDPYLPSEHEPIKDALDAGGAFEGQQVRRIAQNEHSRVVGVGRELVSYELWIYAGGGQPLFAEEAINLDTGLRILFIDTQGFGEFIMRKSSAKLPINGLGATF